MQSVYAVRTILGLGIIGPVNPLEESSYDCAEHLVSSCNRILAYEVDTGSCSNRSFVFNSPTKEEINPFAVRRCSIGTSQKNLFLDRGFQKKTEDSSPSPGKELLN